MLGFFTRRCLNAAATAATAASASSSASPPPATPTAGGNGGTGSGVGRQHTASAVKRSTFAQPGLEGLRIAAYAAAPDADDGAAPPRRVPAAIGHVVAQLSTLVFAVDFKDSPPPSAVSLGSRVYVAYEREDGAAPPSSTPSSSSTPQPNGAPSSSRGFLMGGLVVRVNPNGTFGVLLDNHKVDLAVPQEKIAVTEGVCKFLSHHKYLQVAEWVRSAGLSNEDEVEGTACILYHNGWRAERLYLLEASDIRNMTHLSKSARMSLMEKAEWQRDHHRQMRSIYKERVKERDRRYMSAKYAGILSASVAFCGAFSLFGWNYKNYLKHQRSYQMRFAVKTLCRKVPPGTASTMDAAKPVKSLVGQKASAAVSAAAAAVAAAPTTRSAPTSGSASAAPAPAMTDTDTVTGSSTTTSSTAPTATSSAPLPAPPPPASAAAPVAAAAPSPSSSSSSTVGSAANRPSKHIHRVAQERWIRQVFHQLDTAHPRIVVLTGYFGCGKSSLCRTAIREEGMIGVFVDVRNKEDTLRSVIKALGVPHVEACGDPLDFISEACYKAKSIMNGKTPVIVLKLREGDTLTRVYNEALTLACDRRMCHMVIELPLESLTMTNTSLPRLDFYTVPNFSRAQAYQYIQHRLDALDMEAFLDTVGTNSNDLDELIAAVHQRRVSPTEYTNQKLLKAMRQLQAAWGDDPLLKKAVKRLAQLPYDEGQHEGLDDSSLNHPALRDVIFYNPVQDVWLFKNQVLHTAASCLL